MSAKGSSNEFPLPRFGTVPGDRSTFGANVAAVASALGVALLPWQRHVADVALENADGRLAYRDVGLSTPRQSGKSMLLLSVMVARMVSAPGQRLAYGAQSRLKARGRLFDMWWPLIRRSGLHELFTISRATGAEALRCANGSILSLLSSEESSAHGDTLDLAILDEAWSLEASAEQGVRPTLITRPNAQLWVASAAGTATSAFWRQKVEAGRIASTTGLGGTCYFEWSASDDADPGDPAVWASCMPGLGSLIDESTVAADLAMPPNEFRRAYLNQWPDEANAGWAVIPRDVWMAARV